MIITYFGLPGCGKTTTLCYEAIKALKSKQYDNVYSTTFLKIDGVTYIDPECIGRYLLEKCMILIDEGMIFASARDFKNFTKALQTFFAMHRHFKCDIILFTQRWDGMDVIIRSLSDRVYYVYKTPFLGKWFTYSYRIPYGIIIPKKDAKDSSRVGEIIQGYYDASFIRKLFKRRLFRPLYYKYFDSFETYDLPKLPPKYKPYNGQKAFSFRLPDNFKPYNSKDAARRSTARVNVSEPDQAERPAASDKKAGE